MFCKTDDHLAVNTPVSVTSSVLESDNAIAGMGGQDIYLAVLGKFIPNQGGAVRSIQEALAADDLKKAERLAHTLKGIAATIGAATLSECARQLESAIRQTGSEQYATFLESTAAEMDKVIADVAAYLQKHTTEAVPMPTALSAEEIDGLTEKLAGQLQVFDSKASDTMGLIRQQTKGSAAWQRFAQLDRYVNAYDYENALTEIQRIAQAGT